MTDDGDFDVVGKRVAVLESGGGVLPLLCATAGATSVTGAL